VSEHDIRHEPFKTAALAEGKQWWLGLRPGDLPDHVILTLLLDIEPRYFLDRLDDVERLAGETEYMTFRGRFQGLDVGIVYHGSGSFSISTAIEELARLGISTILRVGNSGGLSENVDVGELVLATGGIRDERMLLDYVPAEYPALADRQLVAALADAAAETGRVAREGLTLSVASFYAGSGYPTAVGVLDEEILRRVTLWRRVGALNIDAETSTVLVMGQLFGMRAGALLGIGNHLVTGAGHHLDAQSDLADVALLGLRRLAGREAPGRDR